MDKEQEPNKESRKLLNQLCKFSHPKTDSDLLDEDCDFSLLAKILAVAYFVVMIVFLIALLLFQIHEYLG